MGSVQNAISTSSEKYFSLRERVIALAWWMEGEGSFSSRPNGRPTMKVNQVNVEPLLEMQSWFGGSISSYQQKNPRAQRISHLVWPDKKSVALSMMVYQFMSQRRKEQIRTMINRYRQRPVEAKHRTHCRKGHEYSAENTGIRLDKSRRCLACHRVQERQRRMEVSCG